MSRVSETLDFAPVLDNGQPASVRKTRPAGEFEVSDMNDFHDLHTVESVPRDLSKRSLANDLATVQNTSSANEDKMQFHSESNNQEESEIYSYLKQSSNVANVLNIVTNGLSALVNSSVSLKKHDWVNKMADFGAKLSMSVNSIFNIYNGHKQKEVFNVAGYFSELAIALLAPYKTMGLLRGVSFLLYQIPNIVTSTGALPKFESYSHNFKVVNERIVQSLKTIFLPETYKDLRKNFGILSGTWGGVLSGAGVLTWLLTGSTKIGAAIKGLGEILIDSFQLSKDHWLCKRTHYINSGLSFIMGSLCEMVSKQKNNEPVTMALYFVGSGIGRMFMTWSNADKEREYPVGGPRIVPNLSVA